MDRANFSVFASERRRPSLPLDACFDWDRLGAAAISSWQAALAPLGPANNAVPTVRKINPPRAFFERAVSELQFRPPNLALSSLETPRILAWLIIDCLQECI